MKDLNKSGQNDIIGKTIMMDDGRELGIISDVFFDPDDGEITGYEISKGIIDDLFAGRDILSGNFSPYAGGDVLVIPMGEEIEMKPNNGGIRKILSDM